MIVMKKRLIICLSITLLICVTLLTILYACFNTKLLSDVSIEIGTKEININSFYKNGKVNKNAKLLTNISDIDLNKIGNYDIEIEDNNKTNIVKLHLVDTTSPKVVFKDIVRGKDYQVNPNDFIESVEDISEYTVSVENPVTIDGYKDYDISIIVKDVANNITQSVCKLTISIVADSYSLELGDVLRKEDIVYDSTLINYVNDEDIARINASPIGEYELKINYENKEYLCKIKKQDTKGPILELNDKTIYLGDSISGKNEFIKSVTDYSGEANTTLLSSYDLNKLGTQEITIEAVDKYNNKTVKTAKLNIIEDKDAPVFSGLTELTVNKHSTVDYNSGVKATDKKDGIVDFTVTNEADTSKYGTYYVTYTAKDKAGNTATEKRKVFVEHDMDDTMALLREFASQAGDDYESIRQLILTKVKYNSNWGGDDPIWYGLTNYKGNCYVHAMIYQEILKLKGYETQLIWVTDKSHYWNLVKINGVWRHSDATPGIHHSMISADTDEVRYANLQGRDWDRSAWPEAV